MHNHTHTHTHTHTLTHTLLLHAHATHYHTYVCAINQAQCLLNLSGDAVLLQPEHDDTQELNEISQDQSFDKMTLLPIPDPVTPSNQSDSTSTAASASQVGRHCTLLWGGDLYRILQITKFKNLAKVHVVFCLSLVPRLPPPLSSLFFTRDFICAELEQREGGEPGNEVNFVYQGP